MRESGVRLFRKPPRVEPNGRDLELSALVRQDGHELVEVEDDGIGGVDPEAGSGIRGLVDRVDALDGSLDVRSEPGLGTRIQVRIPLASANGGTPHGS